MSSFDLGLDNWNPMAEDFNSKQFNSYTYNGGQSHDEEYDLCSLYVQNVPLGLTENAFQNTFREYGRIVRFRFLPRIPNKSSCVALVSFETEAEAEAAKMQLQDRPPLNLQITFAKRSRSNAALKDVNISLAKSNQAANQSASRTLGRGRSQHCEAETLSALKVTVDGNKRIAFNLEKIPELIPNPYLHCLVCKQIGGLSCEVCKKPYCSLACQAENWKNHKAICEPVELKEYRDIQLNYKSEGYVSTDCNSDSERRTINPPATELNGINLQNLQPRGRGSPLPTQPIVSSLRVIPGGSNAEFSKKQLINIKINEIEDTALPLNRDEKVYVCHFQNPSKLWLHLKSAKLVLSEMEKKLKDVIDKSAVPCSVNDVCCILQDGVFQRVQVKEVKPNAVTVYFIDYGNTRTLDNDLIYHLPPVFKINRCQAICCKLVNNDGRENVDWNDQDFSWVQEYTKGKEFKMKAYRCYNNVYDVSLLNDQGHTLMHVITHECTLVEDPKTSVVPSVCSKLKEGIKVTVKAMYFDKEQFWGVLNDDSVGLDKCLTDIVELLTTSVKDAEVVNMSCEEGDVVIGFSTEFQMYYRCVVLKRLRNSFLVRYIDYGNSEEITELRKASSPLLLKQSYVVCCPKPNSMSFEAFQKVFSDTAALFVKSVKDTVAELSFEHESQPYILQCFPWYHGISTVHAKPTTSPEISQNASQSNSLPSNNNRSNQSKLGKLKKLVNSSALNTTQGIITYSPVKLMKDSVPDKKLVVSKKYKVNISAIQTLSEIYVQLIEDEQSYNSLSQQVNQYCTSDTCPKYSAVKDEMICCIFHEDSKWYRAQVLEKLAENKLKVLFVDFGNIEILSEDKIKPLHQKLATEKLAACVSLLNVKTEDVSKLLSKLREVTFWIMEVKDISNGIKVMFYQDQKSLLEIISEKSKFHRSSLKFQKLPSDKVSEVVICHEDDKKLYFQQLKDLKAIFDIQQQINSGKDQVLSGKPEVHNIYCCRSALDNKWYRACVRSAVSPNIYRVQFIDYGNEEDVSSENFKEIAEDLFQFPVYCIPVTVEAGNKPAPLETDKPYSVQVIDDKPRFPIVKFLSENSQKNASLSSLDKVTLKNGINKVVFFHTENSIHYCQLVDCACADMSMKLQDAELKPLSRAPEVNDVVSAKSSDGYWYRASIASVNKNILKVFFIDFGNSETVSIENVKFLPENFCQYPIFGIPVRIKNETDIKINFTEVFELKANGFASDGSQFAEIVFSRGTDLPNISSLKRQVLPVDQVVEVSVCHIENALCYVQLTSSQKMVEFLGVELKNATAFENLVTVPKEGDVICAGSSTDKAWYRGSIKSVSTDQKNCEVFFIDYGNSETIALADLRMLPAQFCDIPILAVPVKLVNTAELEKLLLANVSVFKVKVVKEFADGIPMVEIVTEDDNACFKIESQVLPEALTEVVVAHKEGRVYYVQKNSDTESLFQLMQKLQSDNSIKPISSPKVGQLVCVKFQYGMFYRGLVKEKSGNDVKVFFVDYGNTDKVTDIFNLPPQYSQPMFIIPILISNEETLASPLAVDSACKVKYTGKTEDCIQIVKVCLPFKPLLLPTLNTSILEKGSFEVCFHSSDGQFYFVSKTTDIAQIYAMNCELANISSDTIYHVPSLNEVLIVKSQEKWLRGCVRKTDETSKKCEIYLLDLGSTETIPFSHLFYVPKTIISYPIFINKVQLNSVDPLSEPIQFGKHYTVTVVGNSNEISIIRVLQPIMFTSIERKNLPLNETSTVMFCHKENDTLFLQDTKHAEVLSEVQLEARKCAASEVISHNPIVGELLCAQSDCDGDWYRCCVEEVAGSDKYRILFIDYGNCEIVSKGNLRYLPRSLAKYPSFAIAVKIIDRQPVVLDHLYSVVAVSESVNNLQSVKLIIEEKVSRAEPAEMPKVNENVTVTSSEIISPNNESEETFLYTSAKKVMFSPGEQDIAIYSIEDSALLPMFCTPFIQEDIMACNQLTVDISQYCTGLSCSSYDGETLPEEDQMVLAKFAEDGQWYRAVVLEVNSETSFHVVFVDFGNSAKVDKSSLRKMKKEFMSLPIQAALCVLTGFKVIGDQTSVVTELKKFTIFEKPEPLRAIVTINKADDEDEEITMEIPIITKHLVEKGLVSAD